MHYVLWKSLVASAKACLSGVMSHDESEATDEVHNADGLLDSVLYVVLTPVHYLLDDW